MKKVLITGATSGIGYSTLELLAHEYEILFTYYSNTDFAKEIEKKFNAKGYYLDLGDPKSIEALAQKIECLDVLINNAGIAIDNDFNLKTLDEFTKVVNTNLGGTYYLTKLLVEKMNKDGCVLFVSSTNGIDTEYLESIDYDASKAGIISLMHNFTKLLSPNVRTVTIAPGWVETPMNKELSEDFKKQEEKKIYLNRFAAPKEIAQVIKFMISEDANYINNTVIRVDGGVKND